MVTFLTVLVWTVLIIAVALCGVLTYKIYTNEGART